VIQHVIAQRAVAIFGPPQAVAALAHEPTARFLAQENNRRGPHNCEASSLPKELTGHPFYVKEARKDPCREVKLSRTCDVIVT